MPSPRIDRAERVRDLAHLVERDGPLSDPAVAFQEPLCGVSARGRTITVVPIAKERDFREREGGYVCLDCFSVAMSRGLIPDSTLKSTRT